MASFKDKKNGSWYVQFRYTDWRGERQQKLKRGFATKKEAQAWEREFLMQKHADINMSFESFVALYEKDVKPKLKLNTWLSKEHIIRTKILPYFKKRKLSEITARDVIDWQNEIRQHTKSSGESYSPDYLKNVHTQLSCIFNHAIKYYGLQINPAAKAGNMGSEQPKEMLFWTKEEYLKFIDAMMDKPMLYYAFEILYWCGIREGELLALTPADFDFEKKTLRINKSYQRLQGKDVITTPKTKKSNRVIQMPDFLCDEMQDYKRNHGMPHAKGGYTDRKDCKWSATTIIRILQDETYTGTLVQGKQTTPHFKLKEREDKPSSEWIRVEGTHEAIIQKHDFDLVQRLRRIDTRTSPKSDKVYLFSGILICGCCGCRMTRKTNRYKDKEYHYYYCPTGKKNGCTSSVMLKESDLIECVQDSLKGHIENVASLDALLSSISQERINRELAQEYAAQIRVNEKRVAQTEGFKAKLYENLVSGILTKEEFLSYKRKYNADIELFQKAIVEWNDKLTDVLENRSERNRWINHFMKFSTMEDIDRRAVMQLIRSIRVMGKDELHIEFNYQDEYQKAISLAEQIATKNEERMVG